MRNFLDFLNDEVFVLKQEYKRILDSVIPHTDKDPEIIKAMDRINLSVTEITDFITLIEGNDIIMELINKQEY